MRNHGKSPSIFQFACRLNLLVTFFTSRLIYLASLEKSKYINGIVQDESDHNSPTQNKDTGSMSRIKWLAFSQGWITRW